MKEQQTNTPQGPVELDLFSAAELAEHAMKAAAEEKRAAQAGGEIEFSVTDTTTADAADADAAGETEGGATASGAKSEKPNSNTTQGSDSAAQAATNAGNGVPRKKKKKKKKKGESNKPKTFFDQIHEFINEDEDQPISINLRGLLGGDGLPNFFRRNWLFIGIIVVFTCIYVTCRYMMQSAVLEHDKLTEQLIDRRYKNLTLDCELLERTLSSHVEKFLKDSTIHTPTEQAFPLPVESEE